MSVLSSPHHLVISCDGGGSVLIVPVVVPSHRCSLFIGGGWLSCGGRRAFLIRPSFRSHMSWGKRRRIGLLVHLSLMSLGFSFLFSSCRLVGASRAVSSSWCSLVAMGVSCGSARWRLVVVPGRHSFILRRGGVLALILRLSSRSLLVPPSRVASRLLVPTMGLRVRAAWRACSSNRVCSSRGGGVVGHGAGVSCRASQSRLICSSRAVGRGVSFSSRGASRGRIVIDDVPVAVAWRACGFWGCVSSCRLGAGACLPLFRRGCGNAVLVIGVPACSLSSYGCGA